MIASLLLSLGGLGLAGAGLTAAALFIPTVAALLKSALDFLRSPLGTALGVLALALFLHVSGYIGGDIHGASTVRAQWHTADALRAKALAERDVALGVEMKRIADSAVSGDLTFSKAIDQKVQSHVSQSPAAACRRVTDDDIRRLLSIH